MVSSVHHVHIVRACEGSKLELCRNLAPVCGDWLVWVVMGSAVQHTQERLLELILSIEHLLCGKCLLAFALCTETLTHLVINTGNDCLGYF